MRRLVVIITAAIMLLGPASAAMAEKPTASFPPGTWQGKAYVTGGIFGNQMSASLASPSIYTFELQVQPFGAADGTWSTNVANVTVNVPDLGPAGGSFVGGGTLGGDGEFVTVAGSYAGEISIADLGVSGFPFEFPAAGGFQATTADCNTVYGDLATGARAQQQVAGFSTTVLGPFVATRIGDPGELGAASWEADYVALIEAMEDVTNNPQKIDAEKIYGLVATIDTFLANLNKAKSCPDLPDSFKKGKQPYNIFLEKFTAMMLKVLDNPDAYSGSEIANMYFLSAKIGAIGSAAPDAQSAIQLHAKFIEVMDKKIDADIASGDKQDAEEICWAAKQGGLKGLSDKACGFAES